MMSRCHLGQSYGDETWDKDRNNNNDNKIVEAHNYVSKYLTIYYEGLKTRLFDQNKIIIPNYVTW